MNITRRGFFKIVGAATVATAVPSVVPAMTVVQESSRIDRTQTVYGLMREIIEYDLRLDSFVVRHDIFDGRTQWGVDHILTDADMNNEEAIKKLRKSSADILGKELEKSGVRAADLKKVQNFLSGPIKIRI